MKWLSQYIPYYNRSTATLRTHGITLVRTPPYMAEYAPIEFGWGSMKKAMADLIDRTDDGGVIRTKLLQWMREFPAQKATNFMDKCRRVEEASTKQKNLAQTQFCLDENRRRRAHV